MLWACLRFPQLALDAVRTHDDSTRRGAPFAVVDGPIQRRHVVLADASAQKSGVQSGQPLAASRALCPGIDVAARDTIAERHLLESIASWAYRFSADISLAGPDSVFVEIGASLSLFGGIAAIERRLRHEVAAFGTACSLAIAPTAHGARVLAAHADAIVIPSIAQLAPALGLVALGASGLDAKTVAALHGMGFRLLRDLFRLPRAELARRIGEDAIDHLDRMRGLAAESLLRFHPPDRFERRLEFSFGIESTGALAFPLQRAIRDLSIFLIARDGGVQRFTLVLGHERGASTSVEVGLLAPQRDAASLFELARARLDRIELPAPAHALTLRADDLPPLCPLHRDLFDASRNQALDWCGLAERLRARLGEAALHGISCAMDHRPYRAWRFVEPVVAEQTARRKIVARDAGAKKADAVRIRRRPFWLLHRPAVLRGSILRVLAGPERIESGWWDEHDQRRDYYVVETRRHQRAWAFVEAGSPVDATTSAWMLHGWFA